MLEAEINPAGDVTVEGHHVGSLQGFRFTADQSAGGEDAKAVKAAAQKALAAEFEARAERFASAANGDFALASDGLLRWIGAPVATLAAGEDALSPRVILLADEQLTGPARDKVAARAERFVRYQIDTLLKPLADLKAADQLSGIARGIAFRIVENFGVVQRRDIADDVKSLEQEARAALRRLGVRFGAFHLFVPALLKPGPAGLVTLLWSLANDGKEKPGFGDVVNALASGRTSLAVDPAFEPAFYRLAGYRTLGRRAVRVDILERLADLIRPALSWRAGTGQRPDGAYDGATFLVTPAMMSILGATAEDMEEILKGLGYRAEAKAAADVQAKLDALDAAERERVAAAEAAKAQAESAPEAAAAEDSAPAQEEQPEPEAELQSETQADMHPETQEAPADVTQDAAGEEAGRDDAAEAAAPVAETAVIDEPVAETPVADVAPADVSAPDVVTGDAVTGDAVTEDAPAEEAKPVLLWRPGRFDGRPRHGRNNRPQQGRGRNERQGQGQGQEGGAGDGEGRKRFERRFAGKAEGQGRSDGQGKGDSRSGRPGGKPPHRDRDERHGQPPRKGGHAGKGHSGGGQSGAGQQGDRQQGRPREERPARIDPDSPFAKLAALREQLKGK